MKTLHLCHKVPWPLNDGGSVAIYSSVSGLLRSGISVKTLAMNPSRNRTKVTEIPQDFVKQTNLVTVDIDTRLKLVSAFFNLFQQQSYFVERFSSANFRAALIRVLNENDFDIIQLEHLYMCLYIDTIRAHSNAAIILRPQNVEHQVWKSVLTGLKHPMKKIFVMVATRRLETFEKKAVKKLDGILAISPCDADEFKAMAPDIPVTHVPVGFDFNRLKGYDFQKQYQNFFCIYHLGSMDWQPNAEAVRWFLDEIYPKLRKVLPYLTVFLAGRKMPEHFIIRQDENLHITGTVPDALRYQEDKPVLIVPLLSGGGIRAKIIEAMALGKAVITTTKGIRGIDCEDGKEVMVADTPEEFVEAIRQATGSMELCKKLGNAARQFALQNFSLEQCAGQMIRFYENF